MKKKQVNKFGEHRLLFKQDGIKHYLQKHSWDCGWYWGKGYITTYTNERQPIKSKDISSHSHLDSLWSNLNENPNVFKKDEEELFVATMKQAYILESAMRGEYKSDEAKYLELKDLAESQLNYAWDLLKPE